MAIPKSLKTNFIVKSLASSGKHTADLNPFEFAIVDVDTYTSLATSEVAGKDILFAVGSPNRGQFRSNLKVDRLGNELNSELSFKSQPSLSINAIKTQKFTKDTKTNVYYFGYNGLDDCKTLSFECGKTYQFNVLVKGRPVRNIFGREMTEVINVTAPCCTPCTDGDCSDTIECSQIIDELVKNFNDPNRFISRFYTAEKVQSCTQVVTPANTITLASYCLTLCDNGDEIALANVQNSISANETAGYYSKVKVKERNAPYTTYEVSLTPVGEDNSANAPSEFVQDATVLVNCDECPTGFTRVVGGYQYLVEVDQASSAESSLGTLQALNGLSTLTSRQLMSWDKGTGLYLVTSSTLLTTTTADAKIVKYLGYTQDTCTQDVAVTSSWYECGECYVVERTMYVTIGLADCDASANFLADWDNWLDQFTDGTVGEDNAINITEDGCFMRGSVLQYSNCVTDGCNTEGAPVWTSLPTFMGQVWEEEPCVEETFPTGCKCGIKFTGVSFDNLQELLDLPVYDIHEYVEKDPIELHVSLLEPDGTTQVCEDKQPTWFHAIKADYRTLHGRDVMKEILTDRMYQLEPYWNLTDKEALLLQQREGLRYGVDVNGYYFAITVSGNTPNYLNFTSHNHAVREDVVLFIHEDDINLFNTLKGTLAGAFPYAKFTEL